MNDLLSYLTENCCQVRFAPLTQQLHAIAKGSFIMKRFHVHLHVDDLDKNIAFYSKLFGLSLLGVSDYAKWMLDDPRVNFAISTREPSDRAGPSGLPGR
jgi:hypothetical protein